MGKTGTAPSIDVTLQMTRTAGDSLILCANCIKLGTNLWLSARDSQEEIFLKARPSYFQTTNINKEEMV